MNSKIISFAIEAHSKTNHLYDGKPYSVHLSMVVMYALKHFEDAYIPPNCFNDILNACWLHDTIEDCRMTYNDIKEVAGEAVAEIVYAVTNEKGKNRKQRANNDYYFGIRETAWATYVKLCDRLANVKYSSDTNSRMLNVYRKENVDFLNSMFPDGKITHLKTMVKELHDLLQCRQTHVRRRQSFRLKQLLNWYRTANPEKFTDFHYTRWIQRVGGVDMKDALYKATEDELDDLYILREELRLGI